MDKKGIEMATSTLILLIILGVFLIFAITYVINSGQNVEGITNKYIESLEADYDNDDIRDYYDKSPCVAGEDVIVAEEDGKQYYYFADPRTEGEGAPCNFSHYEEYYKDHPRKDEYQLQQKTDDASNKRVCVLPAKTCVKELERQYLEMRCDQQGGKACDRLEKLA